ncbi:aminotransferase class V-fold PLP-dependent enzyme, partial [Micrococcus sp. SIMBA_144]
IGESNEFDRDAFRQAIQPNTKMIIVSHGSNLTGNIVPIDVVGEIAREKEITFLVDASQTAGIVPIHMSDMSIDLLAFPGHKGLLGPQ